MPNANKYCFRPAIRHGRKRKKHDVIILFIRRNRCNDIGNILRRVVNCIVVNINQFFMRTLIQLFSIAGRQIRRLFRFIAFKIFRAVTADLVQNNNGVLRLFRHTFADFRQHHGIQTIRFLRIGATRIQRFDSRANILAIAVIFHPYHMITAAFHHIQQMDACWIW